jgi:glycosidase
MNLHRAPIPRVNSEGNPMRTCQRQLLVVRRQIALMLATCFACGTASAALEVSKVEPPNWWVGMRNNTVQLMVYGENLDGCTVTTASKYVRVGRVVHTGNPAYVFVDLEIEPDAPAQSYPLTFSRNNESTIFTYPILKRESPSGRYRGFSPSDIIYLITPDRFANGNRQNDSVAGMRDGYRPTERIGRHGGDLAGILQHLDYVKQLGPTTIWINPLIENNTDISYHGYAATDLYTIDPRFGTNELYARLVREAHARGLKVIMDHVSNHISIHHPWIRNLPSPDWLNGSIVAHQNTQHRKITQPDLHSDSLVKSNVTDGWFTDSMPDLNQRNPLLATYLIQNTIWWIESTGLDGIREDTYPYADQRFLSDWANAIIAEYPAFGIFGEVWIHDPAFLAGYQRGSFFPKAFDSHLQSVTDFGLFEAFMRIFGDEKADIDVLHETLAKDFLYPEPNNLVTFLDNHDVARIAFVCKQDWRRVRMALTLLMTLRGIPQLFYGTEVGMVGGTDHGDIRQDFPGGFPGDTHNAFLAGERTVEERAMVDFTRWAIALRREHPSLSSGAFVHFPPSKNVYYFIRTFGDESILVVCNNGNVPATVDLTPLEMYVRSARTLRNLMTGGDTPIEPTRQVRLDAHQVDVFLLAK